MALLARIFHSLRAVPRFRGSIAQVSNLLYRRLPVGSCTSLVASADWKSAIQQTGSLRYAVQSAKLVKYPGYRSLHRCVRRSVQGAVALPAHSKKGPVCRPSGHPLSIQRTVLHPYARVFAQTGWAGQLLHWLYWLCWFFLRPKRSHGA